MSTGAGNPNRSPTGTLTTAPSNRTNNRASWSTVSAPGLDDQEHPDLQRRTTTVRYRGRRMDRCGIPASMSSGPYAAYPSRS